MIFPFLCQVGFRTKPNQSLTIELGHKKIIIALGICSDFVLEGSYKQRILLFNLEDLLAHCVVFSKIITYNCIFNIVQSILHWCSSNKIIKTHVTSCKMSCICRHIFAKDSSLPPVITFWGAGGCRKREGQKERERQRERVRERWGKGYPLLSQSLWGVDR